MSQRLWTWESSRFEKIENEKAKAEPSKGSWDVMLEAPDFAWGYCVNLADEIGSYILWRSRLEVRHILGNIAPGLAFHDGTQGILFQFDATHGKAEARHLIISKSTIRTDVFSVSKHKYPLDMMLEYNAVTSKCSAYINTERVFEIKLPYKNIPLLSKVTAIEIVTSTPPDESGGIVGYGDLSLQCE